MSKAPIIYWDRAAGKTAEELIYGEGFMRWFYETPTGRLLADAPFGVGVQPITRRERQLAVRPVG